MKTHIKLETKINAPMERCFDLSRSIELHIISTKGSDEHAIGGQAGLLSRGDTVTWEARHFFVRQRLTTKIIAFERPFHFKDVMIWGIFKSMEHDHFFEWRNGSTTMADIFSYEVPFGVCGRIFNRCLLERYMTRLLLRRNAVIRHAAEANGWTSYLQAAPAPIRDQHDR